MLRNYDSTERLLRDCCDSVEAIFKSITMCKYKRKKAHVFVKFFASQAAVAAECGLQLSSSSVSVSRKKCRGSYTYYTIATKQLGQKTAVNKEGVEHTLSNYTPYQLQTQEHFQG